MVTLNTLQSSAKTPATYQKLLVIAALMYLFTQKADAQVSVGPNTQMHIQNGASIHIPGLLVDSGAIHGKGTIVNYGDLITNTPAMTDADSITVDMKGGVMGGTAGLRAHILKINNLPGVTIQDGLSPDMKVDTLHMGNGNLAIGNNNVTVGRLANESNQGYVTGLGTLTAQDTIDNETKNIGNLGGIVTLIENGGNVVARRGHSSLQNGVLADVRYDFVPENAQTQPVNVSIVRTVTNRETSLPSDPSVFSAFQEDSFQFNQLPSTSDTANDQIVVLSLSDISKKLSYGYMGDPLAVNVISFSAICENGHTVINWTTLSEEDSNYFEIQRSTDGVVWEVIGQVPAAGNSNRPIDYSFEDPQQIGDGIIYYYRFVEHDNDGNQTPHSIIASNCTSPDVASIVAFPNPTAGGLTIQLQATQYEDMPLEIVDMNGRLVYSQDIHTIYGIIQHHINISDLADGVYVLRAGDENIRVVVTK